MHDIAGLVALAILGLWIAYLVPHRLRYRQQLLESRTEDRFSNGLRVLVVSDARRRGAGTVDARAECGPGSPKRSGLLSPARGVPVTGRPAVNEGRGGVVERPIGTQGRISADDARRAAQVRSQRAASVARRAAAARRRALLTAVLGVASVVAWVVVGVTSVAVVAAVVPTVLLAGVLLLGRRAVVQGRAADAAWERQQRAAVRHRSPQAVAPRVTGRAHRPSDSHTESIAQVPAGSSRATTATTATTAPDAAPSTDTALSADTATMPAAADDAPGADADDAATTDGSIATDATTHGARAGADDGAERPSTIGSDAPAEAGAPTVAEGPSEVPAGERAATVSAATVGADWSPVPVPRPTYTTKATAPRREPLPLVVEEAAAPAATVAVRSDAQVADGQATDGAPAAPTLDLDAILARRRAAGE
ncbi:hypothetical protein [Cellulomonas sp. ATA003]|uniref:hypothetical protein n=1 Tax=Cellulomonas sp. ATA003 TaxID=3073064 RepID=UPI0028734BDA|nr:hypothetical protein [Cellulomonas sp. ATA003]WNB85103.1 hypothetical protein REH70_15790 [Cellulomonas sp. ATA003]